MEIGFLYDLFLQSTGVSIDSRTLEKDNIFFAISGPNFNANYFAKSAIESGALYAIVDDPSIANNKTIFFVKDCLEALQELAKYYRQELEIPIIGLTGSNGKTTTKELINAVLSQSYETQYTKGNFNNHIGVPLSILSIEDYHQIAIIEMGANHQKEIEFLCTIAQPDIGLITNFGKAHLEGFGGVEGVIKGKSELYQSLRERRKVAFINGGDQLQLEKARGIAHLTYGESEDFDFTISLHKSESDFLNINYQEEIIETKLIGDYNYSNAAVALALGSYFEVPLQKMISGLRTYTPSNNRSQLQKTSKNELIVDAYNANPSSMQLALKNFARESSKNKLLILGDMFELGVSENEEHSKILDLVNELGFSNIILIGEAFSKLALKSAISFKSMEEALDYFNNETNRPKGQRILLKGSRGIALERLIPFL